MTTDNNDDPRFHALIQIKGIMDKLDPASRRWVAEWVTEQYHEKPAHFEPVRELGQNGGQVIEGKVDTVAATITVNEQGADFIADSFPNFLYKTIKKENYKKLRVKDQILLIVKYLTHNCGGQAVTPSQILDVVKVLGYIRKDTAAQIISKICKDNYTQPSGDGYVLTEEGEDKIMEIMDMNFDELKSVGRPKGKTTKKGTKSAKKPSKAKKDHTVEPDMDFVNSIVNNEPKFQKFLDDYDPVILEKSINFIVFAVYYVCRVLNKDAATNVEIASCFTAASQDVPDSLGQIIRNVKNRNKTILYHSAQKITLLDKGIKLVEDAKKEK